MTALVPVEGNPFGEATAEAPQSPLVPVEGNPFDTVDHRAMQDRIGYGEMAVRVAKNMAASAKEGFGPEGIGFEAGSEAEHFWRQAGLLNDKDALVGPLFKGATVAGDAFMRAIKGATFAGAGAVEEIVKLSGGDPHHLKYELADAAMFAMNAAPMASPTGISGGLSRIRKGQDGVVRAEPIGETAKPADFQAAAEVLRESAGPPKSFTVFHGSVHEFETFASEAIGTGEGAQAYGHGHYVAGSNKVGVFYKQTVAQKHSTPTFSRAELQDLNAAATWLRNGREGEIPARVRQYVDDAVADLGKDASDADLATHLVGSNEAGIKPGHLYQVEVQGDPADFMSLDKAAGENQIAAKVFEDHGISTSLTGKKAYDALSEKLGSQKAASKALHDAGLPGLTYLDGPSRKVGQGTSNYVVFDPASMQITHRNGLELQAKLRSLYEEHGIHPAEVLADAAQDPALAKRLAADDPVLPPEYTGVDPAALTAAQAEVAPESIAKPIPGVSPGLSQAIQQRLVWPESGEAGPVAPKAVKIGDHIGNLINRIGVGDIVADIQMKTTPMAERNSSVRARAAAKDWANTMRVADFDVQTIVKELTKEFEATPERLAAMWEAADQRGVKLRSGDKAAKLEGLSPAEARIVEGLQERLTNAWNEAKLVGILGEEAEGLESYAPRIVAGGKKKGEGFQTLDPRGRDFSVSSSFLNKRKYLTTEETEAAAKKALGDEAFVVRDIRTMALAEASLMRAVAGRRLINEIKEMGERSGAPTVFEGGIPKGVETFTIDQHPAFYTSKKLPDGTYERQAIRVSREFEGPLRAVLQGDDGAVYQALMDAKAKAMNYIMWSPMTHNMVIYGRAAPEAAKAPISTGLGVNWYVNGNRLRSGSPEIVRDFIQNGLSLIGQGGFIQDITSIRTGQAVVAKPSIEARMLGAVPGLFDARAGTAVKAAVEKTGDLMHNTLLWDRIADMQVGMAKFQYDQLIKDGVEHGVAMKTASHWANRFAGALPIEEMSEAARKISNVTWFSRSFTLGNVGAMKDMFVGLPRSVLAQIERDHGVQALNQIQSKAQRKAVGIIATDMALFYAGNSLLQSGIMAMRGEDDEGYIARFKTALGRVAASPLEALNPLAFIHNVTPNAKNEPGKEDRILWGYDSQGTAQYVKNPFGKVTEDQIGWMLHPMKMLDNKLSPMIKPLKEIQANKDFADRHIYNPYAHTPAEYAANVTKAVWHFMAAQVPTDAIKTAWDLATNKDLTPDDRRLDTLKIVGMISGFSVSQGAKGGPGMGELMREKLEHKYAMEQQLPDVKKAIKEGRMEEATAKMQELKVEPGLQKFFIQTTLNPGAGVARRAMREMIANMPEERRARFMQYLEKGKPE